MEMFILIVRLPQALPYEIALVILVAGLIFAAYKPERWKYHLLMAFELAAISLSAILLCYYGSFPALTFFAEALCAFCGNMTFIGLLLVTLVVRSKRKAYF